MNMYSAAAALQRFRKSWKAYVLQSTLAGITSFGILLALNLQDAVIIAALGASSFIVFGRPFDLTARSRNVIGGHMTGFLVGSLCAFLPHVCITATLASYALSVGLSIFFMVLFYLQHPPAAGTALGVAMRGCTHDTFIAIATITLGLAAAHYLLKPYLKNLF